MPAKIETPLGFLAWRLVWHHRTGRRCRNISAAFPSWVSNRNRLQLKTNDSGTRRKFPPYSRAAATAFHRLPVRGVSCDCGRRHASLQLAACEGELLPSRCKSRKVV